MVQRERHRSQAGNESRQPDAGQVGVEQVREADLAVDHLGPVGVGPVGVVPVGVVPVGVGPVGVVAVGDQIVDDLQNLQVLYLE